MIVKPVKVEKETENELVIRDASGDMICEFTEPEYDEVTVITRLRATYIAEAINAYKKAI